MLRRLACPSLGYTARAQHAQELLGALPAPANLAPTRLVDEVPEGPLPMTALSGLWRLALVSFAAVHAPDTIGEVESELGVDLFVNDPSPDAKSSR